ncbi:MAG: UDP-glucose dehydrogenase family protein [Candidatus Saccharimonadales bacterium]
MRVAVVGTGYVGLVTGTCFAEVGNDVVCVDIDEAKVARLREGDVPIYEPGLSELVVQNAATGRLSFTTSLADAVAKAEVIFLALPTPPQADGSADLGAVLKVADDLGSLLQDYVVVVDKSTVPVGTAAQVRAAIAAKYSGEFDVVSNPEFLREGFAIADFMEPDRVVIGSTSPRAVEVMRGLYRPLVSEHDDSRPLMIMDEASAELSKYAANTFLAMKISFINEIANLADYVGADVDAVATAIGADSRIGKKFLKAGIGYGGSCFPKDVLALGRTAQDHDYDFKLLRAILDVNARQKRLMVDKVFEKFGPDLHGKTFGVWGLAFKPDTDDIRESPALGIIDALLEAGASVRAYDPEAAGNVERHYRDKPAKPEVVASAAAVAKDVDGLIVATEWQEFAELSAEQLAALLPAGATVFDGRNLYADQNLTERGLGYVGVGHPAA